MAEQTQQVIAQARAAAPAQPAVQAPVAPPAPAQPAPQQGFNAPPAQSGFAQPVAPEPVAPVQPVVTDNARTSEQFEKLIESNRRMAETNELLRQELLNQNKNRQQSQQQFAPVQQVPPAQPAQPSAMPKLSDYIEIDENGNRYVNEQKFNAAVADIYQKASRAEEVVKNYVQTAEQREVVRQEREAYTAYPQLNPAGGAYDSKLAQATRAIIYDSMINPQDYGGRPLSFKDAADYIQTGVIGPRSAPVAPPAVNEGNQVQKEQAALAAQNVPQQVTQSFDQDREYQRQTRDTRYGSDEALVFRLSKVPHRIEEIERLQQGNS